MSSGQELDSQDIGEESAYKPVRKDTVVCFLGKEPGMRALFLLQMITLLILIDTATSSYVHFINLFGD